MRMLATLLLPALAAGCFPEVGEREVVLLIKALDDVYQWDETRGAYRSPEYLELLRLGEKAVPGLADAVTDERPTRINERSKTPSVGDVAFLTALKITGLTVDHFRDLRITLDPRERNPILALEFPPGTRAKAADKLRQWCGR